jgi:spoIIIJ-associated protein
LNPEEFDVTETQSQTETGPTDVTESGSILTQGSDQFGEPGDGSAETGTEAVQATAEAEQVDPAGDAVPEADPEGMAAGQGDDEGDQGDDQADGASGAERPAGARRSSLRRLEEEGEVAADYLEELLDIADIDGDIDIDVENGRASVGIVAESSADRSLRLLVGSNGEVLEALQELTRLAVQAATGERSRLMLDVAGFRASRRRTLEGVAARACQEVQRSGEPCHLDPMSAFERKVVHDVVADAGLVSESEGEDPHRHVVIKQA